MNEDPPEVVPYIVLSLSTTFLPGGPLKGYLGLLGGCYAASYAGQPFKGLHRQAFKAICIYIWF